MISNERLGGSGQAAALIPTDFKSASIRDMALELSRNSWDATTAIVAQIQRQGLPRRALETSSGTLTLEQVAELHDTVKTLQQAVNQLDNSLTTLRNLPAWQLNS